jgi:hypothetical protein
LKQITTFPLELLSGMAITKNDGSEQKLADRRHPSERALSWLTPEGVH